jgi:hypothetical protein
MPFPDPVEQRPIRETSPLDPPRTSFTSLIMSIPTPPMIHLKATSDSFPFQEKYIFPPGPEFPPIILGLQAHPIHGQIANRRVLPTNGYFGQTHSSAGNMVSSISLGTNHAQIWTVNGQVSKLLCQTWCPRNSRLTNRRFLFKIQIRHSGHTSMMNVWIENRGL